MTQIIDLFDHTLEAIFEFLPLFSRLKCKEVCHKWLELLMTSEKFRKDRNIVLKNCVIKPNREPMTVFMNTKYPYDILTIYPSYDDGLHETTMLPVLEETLALWRHLGKSITEVHFKPRMGGRVYEILPEMPSVKTITIGDYLMYCFFRSALENNERRYGIMNASTTLKVKNVFIEEITVPNVADFVEKMEYILEYIPKSTELFIKKIEFDEFPNDQMVPLMNSIKLCNLPVQIRSHIMDKNENSLNLVPSKCVGFKFSLEKQSFNHIKTLLAEHPYMNDLHLDLTMPQEFPELKIPYSFPQITKLSFFGIHFPSHSQSFKCFEQLENLKYLEFGIANLRYPEDGQVCHYFGHASVNLQKLEELKYYAPLNCTECATALANSFPNLIQYSNPVGERVSSQTFYLRMNNWKFLESIEMSSDYFGNFKNILENVNEPRFHLRTLQAISTPHLTNYQPEDFQKLNQVFPNLNTLTINFYQRHNELDAIVKAILPTFAHLTTLEIIGEPNPKYIPDLTVSSIINHLTEHGQRLRHLHLPGKVFELKPFAFKVYDRLHNLCMNDPAEPLSDEEVEEEAFGFFF